VRLYGDDDVIQDVGNVQYHATLYGGHYNGSHVSEGVDCLGIPHVMVYAADAPEQIVWMQM
jgi:hypothetical protein